MSCVHSVPNSTLTEGIDPTSSMNLKGCKKMLLDYRLATAECLLHIHLLSNSSRSVHRLCYKLDRQSPQNKTATAKSERLSLCLSVHTLGKQRLQNTDTTKKSQDFFAVPWSLFFRHRNLLLNRSHHHFDPFTNPRSFAAPPAIPKGWLELPEQVSITWLQVPCHRCMGQKTETVRIWRVDASNLLFISMIGKVATENGHGPIFPTMTAKIVHIAIVVTLPKLHSTHSGVFRLLSSRTCTMDLVFFPTPARLRGIH